MVSRTENTKRNIIASYIVMALQIVFQFVMRAAIVYSLGTQYLGLSSLFTSVLGVLNIAELGFTTSIIYFMYKPLANGDTDTVCSLLSYLKRIYVYVGIVILLIGGAITPAISIIVKGEIPGTVNVYILYLLYLINTVTGYFLFAHKSTLLTAMQRMDLTKVASGIVLLLQYILQLIALLVFHNYYAYVGSMVLGTAATNILTAYICRKKCPEYYCHGDVDRETKKDIATKVKGMMICNISSVTYTTLDSIIISMLSGLTLVAVYNNYITIFNAATSLIIVIRSSMQASVGNSVASETVEKNYNDVKFWQFGFSIISMFCMSGMICLFQPFMRLWMGEANLLPMRDVILISIWFMISNVQNAFYLYLMGDGLFNEMKWAYIFSTCFNLTMNIVLGKLIGVTGIILASLLSCFISGTFWQCRIIFKHYFKKPAKGFILTQFKYFAVAGLISFIAYYACKLIPFSGFWELLLKTIICILITSLLIWAVYRRSQFFARAKELFLKLIKRKYIKKETINESSI